MSPAIPDETAGPGAAFARHEPALVDGAAFIDGQIVPVGQARIPILEVGFAHADVTYDVVAVWHGRFFRLDDHLDRFERGCRKLSLTPPQDRSEIKAILHALVARTGLRESYVIHEGPGHVKAWGSGWLMLGCWLGRSKGGEGLDRWGFGALPRIGCLVARRAWSGQAPCTAGMVDRRGLGALDAGG